MLQHIGNDIFQHILFYTEQIVQIGKCHLRLDHPELSCVAGGVGFFSPEGRTEGVDILEGHSEGLAVQLTGNGQIGGLAIEVLGEIHLAVFRLGHIVQIQGGDLEHLACALAVRAGDQGSVNIDKISVLEELVDRHCSQRAYTEHCLEGVGPGTQMGDGPQKLHRVALGLQGIVAGGSTFHSHFLGLDLERLLAIGSQHNSALDDQRSADIDFGNLLEIFDGIVINHLNRGKIGTVVQHNKTKLLAGATISHPTANGDSLISVFFRVLKKLTNRNQFHSAYLIKNI